MTPTAMQEQEMKAFVLDPRQIRPEATEIQRACYDQILLCADQDAHKQHQRTENPDEADVILAPIIGVGFGPFFGDLRASGFFKTHKAKVICYCPDDLVYPAIPGIYPSLAPRLAGLGWACGGHYVSAHVRQHHFEPGIDGSRRDVLFSFVGSSQTHRVRTGLLQLKHPRAELIDSSPTTSKKHWWEQDPTTIEAKVAQFQQILGRTKFALCPRGVSASSIRLFEAMEAGCVPIIIADDLVLPEGPDWSSFCLRVPERHIGTIPALAESMEPEFDTMSKLSRAAWEDYFSEWSSFHRLVEWAAALVQGLSWKKRKIVGFAVRVGEYVLPGNIRVHIRYAIHRRR
jgi:Exostosin family